MAAALFAALILALLLAWTRREPIARDYVDRALAAKGVPARYRIARLGPRSQLLEDVVIGDPRAPDLVADRVEIRIGYGFGWPRLWAVRARGVRLRGRLAGGKLSFGAVDRLLPATSGAPFALPDLDVDLADARMRLATPYGDVGMALDGRGNLADGFAGRLAASSRMLAAGGCRLAGPSAVVRVAVRDRKPMVEGPLRAARLACATAAVEAPRAEIAVSFAETLDLRRLSATFATGAVARGAIRVAAISGSIAHDAPAAPSPSRGNEGRFDIRARGFRAGGDSVDSLRVHGRHVDHGWGPVGIGGGVTRMLAIDGDLEGGGGRLAPDRFVPVGAAARAAVGTPVGPVAGALASALAAAGRGADAAAHFRLDAALVDDGADAPSAGAGRPNRGDLPRPRERTLTAAVVVDRARLTARSGGRLDFAGNVTAPLLPGGFDTGSLRVGGVATVSGGGLPTLRVALRQARAGGPLSGEATMLPYAAGGARLALAPLRFSRANGATRFATVATRFATVATLDGPLGDGKIERLTLPIEGRFAGRRLAIGERCVPLAFARLEIAGLTLAASRLPLCPAGGALVTRAADGRIGGGATIVRPRLAGRIGGAAATIAAERLAITVGLPGFAAAALAIRIGAGETMTRLDVDRLHGDSARGALGGSFAGAGGNIGSVPLLLSQGAGGWRLAGGVLTLDGGLRAADRAAAERFRPLRAEDVKLRLVGGRIAASGRLVEPRSGTKVSDVTLVHDLATGTGSAVLAVPGIVFGDALQPEALTPLTLGVVANVRGTVAGRGDIRWTPAGATSDGTFRTDGLALAAAFGPVTGLKGEIRFSDLLGLVTPPGQVATLAEVNPGVAVTDGVVRYQLLEGQLVRIEGGRWPFSGGELRLDPTTLDFGGPSERRLTFQVIGLDAAAFVQTFELKNVALTGTFDGTLPMLFDDRGGRIVGGRMAVRRGGGTLAYVGEVSNAQLGMFAKLAFDALKSMRYDALTIDLDGALDGELVSRVLFNGTNETPKEAKGGLLAQLTGLPFRFNITIRAPFRGLLNSAQSINDPRAFIAQALPKPPPTPTPVQPQESETVP